MTRAPFPGYYSFIKIISLVIGVIVAYAVFLGIWNTTENLVVATIAFVSILAFWIGTLSVVFRGTIRARV